MKKKYKVFRVYIWEEVKEQEMFKEIIKKNKRRINDYFTVMVFNSYEEMYNEADKIEKECEGDIQQGEKDYDGRTLVCRKQLYVEGQKKVWGYSKAQGFIFLCYGEKGLTFRVISHEVGHAVIGYIGAYFKNKFKVHSYSDEESEERVLYEEMFCYMTGSINNQICVKC